MGDENLQTYFNFDTADLEANRSGKFSEKQKARLATMLQSGRRSRKIFGIFGICLAIGLFGMPFIANAAPLGLLWILFGALSGLMSIYLLWPVSAQKAAFKVRKMQGVVKYSRHIQREHGRPVIGYWIVHVGKSWLNVAENMPAILNEGAEYIVYTYASQGSTHILSAEEQS